MIVGTFNPEWPATNYAEWFYGRTSNNYFWDVLPRVYTSSEMRTKNQSDWKIFCKTNSIAITDLISSIDDAEITNENHIKLLGEYTDTSIATNFKKQIPTNIVAILKSKPTIKNIYLTTTVNTGLFKDWWNSIKIHCKQNNIYCKQLMTPSKGARFLMAKGSGIKMPDFIYNDWKSKWHQIN